MFTSFIAIPWQENGNLQASRQLHALPWIPCRRQNWNVRRRYIVQSVQGYRHTHSRWRCRVWVHLQGAYNRAAPHGKTILSPFIGDFIARD